MPAHKYTILQICIICFLGAIIGVRLVSQYPEWFNGEKHTDKVHTRATQAAEQFITLGSATSTEDSGFFDHVLPIFQAATGLDVHVEAVGSRHALAIAARGDVDVLLVHDRAGEDNFVADGYGIDRRDVMYNDFVIVGPRFDPAGIRGLKDARKAFGQIAAKGALFASRGDSGGTYQMELRLWKLAGVESAGQAWYRDVDQGIGATLNFAAALHAYALTDRATWANFKNRQNLEILTEGDPTLLNFYGSILVNPARWPDVKYNEAETCTAGLHRGPVLMRSRHTASTTRNFTFRRVHDCDPDYGYSALLYDIINVC
jgi:tungstate transport system substrate-binding protein